MRSKKSRKEPNGRFHLVGRGFDAKDGHRRITRAEGFTLAGGSKETHELMTEQATHFSEEAAKRGKEVGQLSSEEFHDIAMKTLR